MRPPWALCSSMAVFWAFQEQSSAFCVVGYGWLDQAPVPRMGKVVAVGNSAVLAVTAVCLTSDHLPHRGIVTGDRQAWRWAFLLGMAASAPLMASLLPGAFEAVPASVPVRERGRASHAHGVSHSAHASFPQDFDVASHLSGGAHAAGRFDGRPGRVAGQRLHQWSWHLRQCAPVCAQRCVHAHFYGSRCGTLFNALIRDRV